MGAVDKGVMGKAMMKKTIAAGAWGVALCVAAPAWSQNVAANPFDTLHQALHLTTAQEAAWKVYRAQATAPNGAQERRKAAAGMFTTLNAPQRMDLVEAEMKQDLLDLQHQSQVLKVFYATLDGNQQRAFDAATLPPAQNKQQP
jgi:hypothetical protein